MKYRIGKYIDQYHSEVLEVWEASVRATHHFLEPEDIDFYKSIVSDINFNDFTMYCGLSDKDEVLGFLGVADNKLEMLFLKPECIGLGIGRALTTLAINELSVTRVDVNEQNVNAVIFYKSFGFEVYDRTPLDGTGKPYPILKMRLS